MTLGSFPKVSAPQAREAARKVLAAAALGSDPVGDRQAKRREMTVAQLVDLYEQEGCVIQRGIRQGHPMKPMTKAYTLARLRHHAVTLLGSRRAVDLTEADIERFSRDVAVGKTAKDEKLGRRKRIIVRGGDGAARKAVRDLSALLSFAQRRRIIQANPVATASVRKTDNRRERFLTVEEVEKLGRALDAAQAEGTNPKAVNQIRLWALTGCRRNEIAGLMWSEVDLAGGRLTLANSKTGRSVRPLGTAALTLLRSLREQAKSAEVYIFPAERGDGFYQGTKRVWPDVVKRAAVSDVTPHTFRHTLGSSAASAGEALLIIGSLLGHANARSTQIYAHIAEDPARSAANRATAPIATALGLAAAKERPSPANDEEAPTSGPPAQGEASQG
jgi:integrase